VVKWSTIFLDAGGVLLHPDWQRFEAAFARRGIEAPASRLAAADPHVRRSLDTPDGIAASSDATRWGLYFETLLRTAGVQAGPTTAAVLEELREEHASRNLWRIVAPDAPSFLARMREAGLRLVVVSNSNGTLRAHFDELGLLASFDLVVDSAEEGVEKPDPRIFEEALRRSGADRGRTVHIGDLWNVDVVGARRAGLEAILLDPLDLYREMDGLRVTSLVPGALGLILERRS
jgi:HAD superfamily hydrolase (TIGR01662 family)